MKQAVEINKSDSSSKRVIFELSANPNNDVYLVGTFNKMDAKKHQMKDTRGNGKYAITLVLPKGEYEYNFVVNGNWAIDPRRMPGLSV